MNNDLKMRLSHKPTSDMETFFDCLCQSLVNATKHKETNFTVTLKKIKGDEDDTAYVEYDKDNNTFEIVIDSRLDFGTRCDYLVHEFSHVACWFNTLDDEEDHNPLFGIAYAAMYREYLEMYDIWWS